MDRSTLIDALSLVDGPPSRARLQEMEAAELADVANRIGVDGIKAAVAVAGLGARLDKLESELSDAGIATNQPPETRDGSRRPADPLAGLRRAEARARNNKGISFEPKSTLGCGPGSTDHLDGARPARNEDRSGDGISFTPRSTLGVGPGDSSRFDR